MYSKSMKFVLLYENNNVYDKCYFYCTLLNLFVNNYGMYKSMLNCIKLSRNIVYYI